MTEIKTCKNCRNDYAYDADKPQYKDYCPTCVDSLLVSVAGYTPNIKDKLAHDKSYHGWARKEKIEREVFMRKKLSEHLKWWDLLPFWIFVKLADYFENRVKIIHLQGGDSYQNGIYGVEIYGRRYLKSEKTEKEIVSKEYPPAVKDGKVMYCVCDIAGVMRTENEIETSVCSLCLRPFTVKPNRHKA